MSLVQGATITGAITVSPKVNVEANKNVTPTSEQVIVTPSDGYDAMAQVTVGAVSLQNKTVTPSASQQTVTADSGYNGLGTVTVEAASGGDTLNTLFNTPAGATPTPFTMSDDNANHTCYGFANGLAVTLGAGVKSFVNQAFKKDKAVKSIAGQDIETIGSECFSESVVQSVSFPKCTSIGSYAFKHCDSLSSINFPLCQTVGERAFENCGSIATIDLPACVTVGNGAFGDMQYTTINLPVCTTVGESALRDFKGQVLRLPAVQTMGREQFRYCDNITDLYLGYNGVVAVTRETQLDGWEMFPRVWGEPMAINVHVPAGQLANYQADTTWQEIVTASASDNVTVTFVGDYA